MPTTPFGPLPINSIAGAFLFGFPALFSIINPIGSALIFNNYAAGQSRAERVAVARQIAAYALLLLMGSLWFGSYLLNFFGVSLGALRVAGGLVVAVNAWGMLMEPDPDASDAEAAPPPPAAFASKAFFPLTMPLTTGPGAISVAIALASTRPARGGGILEFFGGLTLAAVANVVIVLVSYAESDRVMRFVGSGGARVVSRLTAFLLLCIGVQIMATGAEALMGPWVIHTARQLG
jgi:multiple antibiotic resistance protein